MWDNVRIRRIGENIFKERKEYFKILIATASKCRIMSHIFFFLIFFLYSLSFIKFRVGTERAMIQNSKIRMEEAQMFFVGSHKVSCSQTSCI